MKLFKYLIIYASAYSESVLYDQGYFEKLVYDLSGLVWIFSSFYDISIYFGSILNLKIL